MQIGQMHSEITDDSFHAMHMYLFFKIHTQTMMLSPHMFTSILALVMASSEEEHFETSQKELCSFF